MKKFMIAMSTVLMIPAVAMAQDVNAVGPAVQDVNSDGYYSLKEVQKAYPNVTEAEYKKADADKDGNVTGKELSDAVEARVFAE